MAARFERAPMTSEAQTLDGLCAELTVRCQQLRRRHHLAAVAVFTKDGRVVSTSGLDEAPRAGMIFVKLLVDRVLVVAIASPGDEVGPAMLRAPNHPWFRQVAERIQSFLDAVGPERADRELPVMTDADIDDLFNQGVPPKEDR